MTLVDALPVLPEALATAGASGEYRNTAGDGAGIPGFQINKMRRESRTGRSTDGPRAAAPLEQRHGGRVALRRHQPRPRHRHAAIVRLPARAAVGGVTAPQHVIVMRVPHATPQCAYVAKDGRMLCGPDCVVARPVIRVLNLNLADS